MPSKKNNNGSMLQAQSKQRKKGRNRGSKKPGQPNSFGQPNARDYMRMLTDPCDSPLIPGFYGSSEGYLSRYHSVANPAGNPTNSSITSGVFLWCPDFTNQGTVTYSATGSSTWNCLIATQDSPGLQVDLRGYIGKTQGTTSTSAGIPDPAYGFISGTVADTARCLSACVKMTYLGTLSSTQGIVAHVDLPFSVLEAKITGEGLTIDDFFTLSDMVTRTSLDNMEQKWTPGPLSESFRGYGGGQTPGASADYLVNVNNGVYSVGSNAISSNPRIIGFAWKGFSSATDMASTLQFDLYKNIEWKPQAGGGLSAPRIIRTAAVPPVHVVTSVLDRVNPEWKRKMADVMKSKAAKIAETALAGAGKLVSKRLPNLAGFLM
jgi:hypothetical protein